MNEQQLSLEDVETLSNISEIERTTTTVREKFKFATPMKKCRKCGEWKQLRDFFNDKTRSDGVHPYCKVCHLVQTKQNYLENIEERRVTNREYRKTHHEEIKEYMKKWYATGGKELKQEYNFLYTNPKSERWVPGFLWGTGICLMCGSVTDPLALVNHHVVPWDDDFIISLCGSCHHRYYSRSREAHMAAILRSIERSPFLWSEFYEESNKTEEHSKIGEESPLVEVLVR